MPTTLGASLKTHLQSGSTTMAPCLLVRRRDGVIKAATLHDRPLTITLTSAYTTLGAPSGAITYEPADAFNPTSLERTSDFSVQNTEIDGGWDVDGIDEAELRNGLYDGAEFWLFEVNWANLAQGIFPRKSGTIGETTPMDYMWKLELRGPMQNYTQIIGSKITPECPYNLGSDNGTARDCKVDISSFTEIATVVSVNADGSFVVSGLSHSDPGLNTFEADWYQLGIMTGVSSPPTVLAGLSQEIKSYDPATGTITPWIRFPLDPDIGDTFSVTPGCNKTSDHCKLKFDNFVRFGGFPFLPGEDAAKGYYVPPPPDHIET